jgi:pimeloyl-ACP methyl ester carboxylesterase
MRRARRILAIVGAVLGGTYLAVTLAACLGQRALIFPAPQGARVPELAGAALLKLPGPGGSTVYALHLPAPEGAATVAYFHGNAEQLADGVPLAEYYRAAGLGFFEVEYPGYGLAGAQAPSEEALYAAAEAGLVHLKGELHVAPGLVVLQGRSLGTGVAVEMAKRGHGARLALISPYTSITDLAHRLVPFLPTGSLVFDRFDSASKAALLSLPVLIIHGTADQVIPVEMGIRLGALIPKATVQLVEGAGHNDLLGRAQVLDALVGFARAAKP